MKLNEKKGDGFRARDKKQGRHFFGKVDCVPAKKNALYLSVNAFSRKVLFGDTIFTRDPHFTWSFEAREAVAPYRLKEYLHF